MTASNLLSRLHKWASRQDENFQTEVFAHLLEHLLVHEPEAGVLFLRKVSGDVIVLSAEESSLVRITTQVSISEGRPDIEISTPRCLVHVEAKVEADLQPKQLDRYRSHLNASGKERTGLILLTRYPFLPEEGEERPDRNIRWFQVADWLSELAVKDAVCGYLVHQYVEFLRAKGMTLERVTGELTGGGPALFHLLSMLKEVLQSMGLNTLSSWDMAGADIGFYVEGQRYWIGVNLTEAQKLSAHTWKLKVDKEKAESSGLGDGIFASDWPKETQGLYRWGKWIDLGSDEVRFFDRSTASQMEFIERAMREFLDEVTKVEAR